MLGSHKLIVDEWPEVLSRDEMWNALAPYADSSFWQWPDQFDSHAFYIVGRNVFALNRDALIEISLRHPGRIIFSNPAEGSSTVLLQMSRLGITDLVRSGHIGLLASGDMEPGWQYCRTDFYFTSIVERSENQQAHDSTVYRDARPYDFLFLNGRLRAHRKYMIDRLRERAVLDRALWSNLDTKVSRPASSSQLPVASSEALRLLPSEYEIPVARQRQKKLPDSGFVKPMLFDNAWGDAVVNGKCYQDTWFSVVTETVFDSPHAFRTEKIWKPILMEHPFIVAAGPGYYRDLKQAGFRTFDNVIDESFDDIEPTDQRLDFIIQEISRICSMDLRVLWHETQPARKYNRQRLIEYHKELCAQFPNNLRQYLDDRSRISTAGP